MKKIRRRANDVAVKVGAWLNKPTIRRTSKLAFNILNTAHLVRSKNPLSIAAAALSAGHSVADAFHFPHLSNVESYVESKNLVCYTGTFPRLISGSRIGEHLKFRTVTFDEIEELVETEIGGQTIYFRCSIKKEKAFDGARRSFGSLFYSTQELEFEPIFNSFWKYYPDGLYLGKNTSDRKLSMKELPREDRVYVGPPDIDKLAEEIKSLVDKGISRSYMFCGDPGTGKTTAAMEVATRHFPKILKVDPWVIRSLSSGELEFYVDHLRPGVLLLDDFDWAYVRSNVGSMLSTLEHLKQMAPNMVIIATVNDFNRLHSALYRPGRFDEVKWFELPDQEQRLGVLSEYAKIFGIECSKIELKELADKTEGYSQAYLKEMMIRISHYPGSRQETIDRALKDFEKRKDKPEPIVQSSYIEEDYYDDYHLIDEDP